MTTIDNKQDVLNVRDIIERFEELETALTNDDGEVLSTDTELPDNHPQWEEFEEYKQLKALLEEMKGNGGDEQWRGDWYPITLIHDDYFTAYAEDLASEIGAVDRNASWPLSHIDWDSAAQELKQDYTSMEYGNSTYWYR